MMANTAGTVPIISRSPSINGNGALVRGNMIIVMQSVPRLLGMEDQGIEKGIKHIVVTRAAPIPDELYDTTSERCTKKHNLI